MRYKIGCLSFAVLQFVLCGISVAQSVLRVDESATKIELTDNGSLVHLAVQNLSPKNVTAHVRLELVSPGGGVAASNSADLELRTGKSEPAITLPRIYPDLNKAALWDFGWYRLRYSVASGEGSGTETAKGVISVARAMHGIFILQVMAPELVVGGRSYVARVRAVHPVTHEPVAGVPLTLKIDDGADEKAGKARKPITTITDRRGYAKLPFTLSNDLADDVDFEVSGKVGGFETSASDTLRNASRYRVTLSTDKLLYQPGQVMHARVMAFDPDQKAMPGLSVDLTIKDPEDTIVYRGTMKTSKFGIASVDWQVPDNLKLGTYEMSADTGDMNSDEPLATANVKISRYELPTFTVATKSDRVFYLPGENASVEVRADYLYGEPVKTGHVKVVEQEDRTWNFREQKWNVNEGSVYEGDVDKDGKFIAHVDLAATHKELADSDYQRFRDIRYEASFTDKSTGRTEQRRFDLRLTKDRIHIYVLSGSDGNPDQPMDFYITADYADGRPAQCDVEISAEKPEIDSRTHSQHELTQLLRKVRTNSYGVARVSGLPRPETYGGRTVFLDFVASDRSGATGRHTESFYSYGEDYAWMRLKTEKAIYAPGETIRAEIESSQKHQVVFVQAVHDGQAIETKEVTLSGKRTEVEFGPNERFQGQITLLAYAFGPRLTRWRTYGDSSSATRTVIFPKNDELKVDVKMAKASYKPGEQASANIHVSDPSGVGTTSALGLVVVDKAVEERERIDEEFGARFGFYSFLESWRSDSSIGGVSLTDLNKLDMTKPLADGLDLVAEMLLFQSNDWPLTQFSSDEDEKTGDQVFADENAKTLAPLRAALGSDATAYSPIPHSVQELEALLAKKSLKLADFKDPWGMEFRPEFSVERDEDVLTILSAGPDKQFDTGDDFSAATIRWHYFALDAAAIQNALYSYHARTGAYIRDEAALTAELERSGEKLEEWRDPWGTKYRYEFGINGPRYTVTVTSAGPDRVFNSDKHYSDDDFTLATPGIDFFVDIQVKMQVALLKYFNQTTGFPQNQGELKAALALEGLNLDEIRDGWGRPVYATFSSESRYMDNVVIQNYESNVTTQGTKTTPATGLIRWIYVRSAGEDGTEGTPDDYTLASFSRLVLEQASQDKAPKEVDAIPLSGSTGAISGTITDAMGAALLNAEVTATHEISGLTFSARSDDTGHYTIKNVPAGVYSVAFSMAGFRTTKIAAVPVRSSLITTVNAELQVGTVTETVEVTASATVLQTTNATVSTTKSKSGVTATLVSQAATPRLREYFPETLVWKPEIVTDKKGRATLEFPLADNITTWKLSAVASTVNGEIGVADKEIRAFQPFFVEHDPPRFLTVGDEISLPVVLRNYLEKPLDVSVTMKPGDWFKPLSATSVKSNLAAGNFVSDVFRFSTTAPVRDAKQEVDAIASDTSDATAKPITVRPNGQEKSESRSGLLTGATSFDFAIPAAAMQGTVDARLKIYPNLEAHVLESIEEIMERPYGCAEQTISSTYPSLLFLRYAKQVGREDSPIAQRARRYLERGYQRLLGYRSEDGGITYWGRGESDTALTAYALRFFTDASEFISVDDDVRAETLSWLLKHADADGKWPVTQLWGNHAFDEARTEMVTAYVARVLAETKLTAAGDESARMNKTAEMDVRKALVYLAPKIGHTDDPYGMASYALAAIRIGEKTEATPVIARLRALEHREADTSYWLVEMNTPFYGWGRAGRVETTSLVLRALAAAGDASDSEMESRGLLFLLKEQDRYGEWYSTQATILALDTIASVGARGSTAAGATKAEVFVDGVSVGVITLPPASEIAMPVEANLSRFLAAGAHRIEVKQASGAARASYQIVANYYVPWSDANIGSDLHHEGNSNEAVRLAVQFDKQDAAIGDVVRCSVDAERVGFRGYGMMLAEIGLPPGAEVDRASLERAMRESGWQINQYDVLPDRIIVYLWPYAGGTKFTFDFKERYGVNALTAASTLYDYYNPDARAVVQPVRFTVR